MTPDEVAVRQHDDGTWYARPYLGRNAVTGKPIRPYRRFPSASCEAEALEMARDWAATLEGAAAAGTSTRLVDVLSRYVDDLEAIGAADNTVRAYRGLVSRYVEPNVGNLDVEEVRPATVEALYEVCLLRGGRDGRALSAETVLQLHWFLRGAFRWVVRREISPFDPMPSVAKPRPGRREAACLFDGDVARLRAALDEALHGPAPADAAAMRGRSMAMAAFLALWTGARAGEALAVSVGDCRLELPAVRIGATVVEARGRGAYVRPGTKGGKGRTVSVTDGVAGEIRRHVGARAAFLPARLASDRSLPLCCDAEGGAIRPTDLSEWFAALRDRLGLPASATFHTLRHTHATYLIMNGADMRTVQERLGHANVSTTLALYSHVVPGRDRQAAEIFERAAPDAAG